MNYSTNSDVLGKCCCMRKIMGQQDSHLGLSSIRQIEWIARKALKKLWELCGDSISHHGLVEKCLDLKVGPRQFCVFKIRCASSWYQEKLSWKCKIGQSTYCTLLYIDIYIYVHIYMYIIIIYTCYFVKVSMVFRTILGFLDVGCFFFNSWHHDLTTYLEFMGGRSSCPKQTAQRFGMSTVCSILLGSWTMASSEATQPTGVEMGWDGMLSTSVVYPLIFLSPLLALFFFVWFFGHHCWNEQIQFGLWALM